MTTAPPESLLAGFTDDYDDTGESWFLVDTEGLAILEVRTKPNSRTTP